MNRKTSKTASSTFAFRAKKMIEAADDNGNAATARAVPDGRLGRIASWLPILLLVLAGVALLPGVASDYFFSDSEIYILENEALRAVPLSEFWRVWQTPLFYAELLPLRDLVYRVEMSAFGLEPIPYKVVNLILLILGGVAAWILAGDFHRRFPAGGRAGAPAGIAAAVTLILWIAHPSHVESVAWAAGLKDLLSGLLGLVALCAFQRALPLTEERRGLRLRLLVASVLLFSAALMSKITVAPVAGMALLLSVAVQPQAQPAWRALAKGALPALPLLAVAVAAVAVQVTLAETGDIPGGVPETLGGKFERALRIIGTMYQLSVIPYDLRLTWDVYQGGTLGAVRLTLAVLAIVGAAWGMWAFAFRRVPEGFGLAAALGATVPVLHLVPFDTWSLASERHLYWPVFGLALAAGSLAARSAALSRATRAAGVLAVAAAAIASLGLTLHRSLEWYAGPGDLLVIENEADPSWAIGSYLRLYASPRVERSDIAMNVATRVADPIHREMLKAFVVARDSVAQAKQESGGRSAIIAADRAMLKAETSVRAALKTASNPVSVWLAYKVHGALATLYEDLIELAPEQGAFPYNLALIKKNYRKEVLQMEAERLFIQAVKTGRLPPAVNANSWDQIAILRLRRGDPAGARQALLTAMAADPAGYRAAYRLLALEAKASHPAGYSDAARRFRERASAAGMAPGEIEKWIKGASEIADITENIIIP